MNRRGFALLGVLWVITGLTALAFAATLAARESVAAARNRVAHTRAAWRAEGCANLARARLDQLLTGGDSWQRAPLHTARSVAPSGCVVRFAAAGSAVDVNRAGEERLVRLGLAAGARPAVAESVAHAILDWRDEDSVTRRLGAEAGWYRARKRIPPRNGPFEAQAELLLVRGVAPVLSGDSLLGVEPGRTPINLAPLPVVASLPGIGPEVLLAVAERRRRGELVAALAQLGEGVTAYAREGLFARFADLAEAATVEPEAWILTATAHDGSPPVAATLELRLLPASGRIAVVRRRTW